MVRVWKQKTEFVGTAARFLIDPGAESGAQFAVCLLLDMMGPAPTSPCDGHHETRWGEGCGACCESR